MIGSKLGSWDGEARDLYLAPMAGVSELPFRLLARECGADITITEFTSSAAITREVAKSWTRLESHPDENPFIPQIFGGEQNEMILAAQMLDKKADIIDLNFGCPAPKVTRICAGAALMGQPRALVEMTGRIIDEIDSPVTAKMRLGTGPDKFNALEISQELECVGVERICIHGRTLSQRYSGVADWNYISKIVESVEVPVVANGDITDGPSAKRCLETTSASGLMIGRAAIGRPTIFAEIKSQLGWIEQTELPWVDDEWFDLSSTAQAFASRRWAWNRYLEIARQTTGLRPKWLKRHAVSFTKGLPGAKATRQSMHGAPTVDVFADTVSEFFAQKVDSHSSMS